MQIPFPQVGARRIWFVPGLRVWGSPSTFQSHYLVSEHPDDPTVFYGSAQIGESAQSLTYAELIDSRGNSLPEQIAAPRVVIRPRSDCSAFVIGQETDYGFKIARAGTNDDDTVVDLLILELGH